MSLENVMNKIYNSKFITVNVYKTRPNTEQFDIELGDDLIKYYLTAN